MVWHKITKIYQPYFQTANQIVNSALKKLKVKIHSFFTSFFFFFTGLGRPLAAPLGAYLLRTGGYVCVFSTSLVGIVLGSLFCIIRIRSFKWNPPKKSHNQKRVMFSPFIIWDSFRVVFKKRAGPNRKFILILMAITVFTIMPFFGEFTVSFAYVRIRYNWGVDELSTYSSITGQRKFVQNLIEHISN